MLNLTFGRQLKAAASILTSMGLMSMVPAALADEPCQSPYMAKIKGEEQFVYVWTLGIEGVGDGSDKLVTVDVRKDSPTFGKVIDTDSVGGRNEAHHGGLTDDRRQYWVAGLDSSKIFIFDIATDPANPKLVKTIDDFVVKSGGVVGPHGAYALPGRMLISALSNNDKSGRTALVEYSNDGDYIATHWMPTAENPQGAVNGEKADGYGYDARVLPRRNVMLSSSFTGWKELHAPARRAGKGWRCDEGIRRHHGSLGFPCPQTPPSVRGPRCSARGALGIARGPQLCLYQHSTHFENLARL